MLPIESKPQQTVELWCADYHYIRNWLYVQRHMGARRADQHMPEFAKRLVAMYDKDGAVSKRCALPTS